MKTKTLPYLVTRKNCFVRINLPTQSMPLDYYNWPIKTVLAFIIARKRFKFFTALTEHVEGLGTERVFNIQARRDWCDSLSPDILHWRFQCKRHT